MTQTIKYKIIGHGSGRPYISSNGLWEHFIKPIKIFDSYEEAIKFAKESDMISLKQEGITFFVVPITS